MILKFIEKLNKFFNTDIEHLPADKYNKEYKLSTVGVGRGGLPLLYTVYTKNDQGNNKHI